jgi:general secretion pathway protein D
MTMSNAWRAKAVVSIAITGLLSGSVQAQTVPSPEDDGNISTTIIAGEPQQPAAAPEGEAVTIRRGDISLNFPSSDVRTVAKAVLGDLLGLPFSVAPGITTAVTVVTPGPIARGSVLLFLEDALRSSDLALVEQNGTYEITTISEARASGAGDGDRDAAGFSSEVIQLEFVSAQEMQRLLDPVLPGVITSADSAGNRVTLSGTSGQRASMRDLLRQFDVNWLRGMSFALYIPRRTDSRLIVPELEKLLNAPDSPTRDLVRLVSMDRLNGILAISRQQQYLDDVASFIEILDREGQNNEPRLFVYRVQNGRSRDLARTLNIAFGNGGGDGGSDASGNNGDLQFAQSPDGNGRADESRGNRSGNGGGDSLGGGGSFGGSGFDNSGGGFGGGSGQQSVPAPNDGGSAATRPSGINANISSDDNNNAIVVFGTPREYAIIEDALRKLDILPSQILIEAAITEVGLNNELRYGLQWNFTSGSENATLTDATAGLDLVRNSPGFSFAFSPSSTINGVLNTLESKTNVNVVSAPKLLVLNNQTAVLQVGDEVPVATQNSTSNIDANAPTINSIEYRNTGVILKVTPRVNANGIVMLDVSQEVSDVNDNVASVQGINSPTISTRRISSSVAVKDGEVLALGGLIRNTRSKGRRGIPFLSQIPVIGGLFGRQTNDEQRTELIVLIKPRVLRTVDDGKAVTEELRAKIQTLEPFKSSGDIP